MRSSKIPSARFFTRLGYLLFHLVQDLLPQGLHIGPRRLDVDLHDFLYLFQVKDNLPVMSDSVHKLENISNIIG